MTETKGFFINISDFIQSFCILQPIIFQRILIFQLFPRTAAMGLMQYRQRSKQVILKPFFQRLMRNSYIMPVLFRIQLMEVECFQEIQCQQGTAETAMLFLRKHLVFLTFRKKIGIVDFSFLIDCDGSGSPPVLPLR